MTENFETPISEEAREDTVPTGAEGEVAPLTPERVAESVDARIGQFSGQILDASAHARDVGVEGAEADVLVSQYNQIAGQLKQYYERAGALVKGGVLGGVIAVSGGNALAQETDIQGLEDQVSTFASAPTEDAIPIPTAQQQESVPIAEVVPSETLPDEIIAKESPQNKSENPEQEIPSQNDASETIGVDATSGDSERVQTIQTPDERRSLKDQAVIQDTVGMLTMSGTIGDFAEKHTSYIAHKIIPGAGLKHALTGVDEYGENLSGTERLKAFGEGALELASYGGSKVLRGIASLFRIGRATEKLIQNPDTSSVAKVVSEVARAIPGGRNVMHVADAVEIFGAVSGPIIDSTSQKTEDAPPSSAPTEETQTEIAH